MVKSVTTGIYYPESVCGLNLLQLVYITRECLWVKSVTTGIYYQRVFVVKSVTTGVYYPESVCG